LGICCAAASLLFSIAACVDEDREPVLKTMTAKEVAQCAKDGGRPETSGAMIGKPAEYCHMPAPDEGKSCSRETDCSGVCSATTRTCTVIGEGEWSILDENGEVVVIAAH
jgi:putative hemolysin